MTSLPCLLLDGGAAGRSPWTMRISLSDGFFADGGRAPRLLPAGISPTSFTSLSCAGSPGPHCTSLSRGPEGGGFGLPLLLPFLGCGLRDDSSAILKSSSLPSATRRTSLSLETTGGGTFALD